MTLPKITITLGNGNLGNTNQTSDGVAGMVLSGASVSGKVQVDTPYLLTKLKDAEDLGILSAGVNAHAHRQIADFYEITGDGAQLYILLSTATIDALVLKTNADYAVKLLNYAQGKIRLLGASVVKPVTPTIVDGLYEKVHDAVSNAQALAEEFTENYKPLRVIMDGIAYDGTPASLKDYKTDSANRVAILLSGEVTGGNADVGKLLGIYASLPVQRKASRVANGKVEGMTSAYFTSDADVDSKASDWDAIDAKGYIFHKTHVGRSGYYISSDVTATIGSDDYNTIPRGRVIDKALTIGYDVLLDRLSDEVEINADGTISPAVVKGWEQDIEDALNLQMTANKEVSSVQVVIDPAQNVISTNKVEVSIRLQPVGYSDFIDVNLGYTITTV